MFIHVTSFARAKLLYQLQSRNIPRQGPQQIWFWSSLQSGEARRGFSRNLIILISITAVLTVPQYPAYIRLLLLSSISARLEPKSHVVPSNVSISLWPQQVTASARIARIDEWSIDDLERLASALRIAASKCGGLLRLTVSTVGYDDQVQYFMCCTGSVTIRSLWVGRFSSP